MAKVTVNSKPPRTVLARLPVGAMFNFVNSSGRHMKTYSASGNGASYYVDLSSGLMYTVPDGEYMVEPIQSVTIEA